MGAPRLFERLPGDVADGTISPTLRRRRRRAFQMFRGDEGMAFAARSVREPALSRARDFHPRLREGALLGTCSRIDPHFTERYRMDRHLIAVIDDDDDLCSSIGDFLRANEYRVELFLSAEPFLACLNRFHFDCVIADIHMPGTSGLTLVQELRAKGSTIPVILITGLVESHLDDVAMSIGAQCLLRKPLETATLLNQLAMSLPDERC